MELMKGLGFLILYFCLFYQRTMSLTQQEKKSEAVEAAQETKLPCLFLSHGAGPCFFMTKPGFFESFNAHSDAAKWYKQVATQCSIDGLDHNPRPSAILVISAHWETHGGVRVSSQNRHSTLLYDYGGFPAHTYKLEYDCPGSPELAQRASQLVEQAGIPCATDSKRNLDHGVFIPLKLVYPEADIPVVEMSVHASLDPELHLKIGQALAPLRNEGVLIIGSGEATHGRFQRDSHAKEFVSDLTSLLEKEEGERNEGLQNWDSVLRHARQAHGREEHLIPLMAVVGAAGGDKVTQLNDHWGSQLSLASYSFS